MFNFLFGWRKASRCKKLIRQVQCRLKLLRNKRDSIIRQLREDVVQLIKGGHQESALSRIEQLYKDQNIKAVYDLLDSFCEFVIINLPYIRRHRDCPNDINEAVSSLLFASARCGDLPELIKLRVLFSERYGQKFALAAVELSHGNLVNRQMIENLCVKSIHDDLKLSLLKEIARDNGIRLNYPETYSEFELQDNEKSRLSIVNSDYKWIEYNSAKDAHFMCDGVAKSNNSIPEYKKAVESRQSCFEIKKDAVGAVDIVDPRSHQMRKTSVNKETFEELGSLHEAELIESRSRRQISSGGGSLSMVSGALVPQNMEKVNGTGSDSPSRFSERSIVYLDDVEELMPSRKDVEDKDQRLFIFRSNTPLGQQEQTALTIRLSGIQQDDKETFEPSDGKSSSRSSSTRRKSLRKGLKRRYVIVKNLSMKDAECALYYGKSDYSSSDDGLSIKSYNQRMHQRKMASVERSGIKASHRFSRRSLQKGVCGEDLKNCNYTSDEASSTNVKTNPKGFRSATNKATRKEMKEPEVIDCQRSYPSSRDSSSRVTSPWTQARPPYLRAMTMPPVRPKETPRYEMLRSASDLPDQQSHSNLQSPSYVHPKLPEYDDLEAMFKALKKDRSFSSTY